MASMDLKTGVLTGIAIVLVAAIVLQYDPTLFGLLGRREGFATQGSDDSVTPPSKMKATDKKASSTNTMVSSTDTDTKPVKPAAPAAIPTATMTAGEGFADLASMEGPAAFASAEAPAGCYPRDQLTPVELLPADQNTIYAQQNPMGVGSLKGKNFLSAGALIGVNTVGQSLRNANLQLRSEPPNPQVPVSIFLQSTIGPDISHRPLEVGS